MARNGIRGRSVDPPGRVVFCGCGDSHHASHVLAYAARIWGGMPAEGLHAMEAARYLIPRLDESALVVGISVSGETARTVEALQLAAEVGARTVAITAGSASLLANTAHLTHTFEVPEFPFGPGLLSYLGSLLAGYSFGISLAPPAAGKAVDQAIGSISAELEQWAPEQVRLGRGLAQQVNPGLPIVFLGSGPLRGSAMFAAAKVIEAAGQPAWAQDVEEWAHLEYFCEPPELPVWLLSARGRSAMREVEVEAAAAAIGRELAVSAWLAGESFPLWLRETLAPLVLWPGPVAYADALMERIGADPFRGFEGGRSREGGGGASRIRSSDRLGSVGELDSFEPRN